MSDFVHETVLRDEVTAFILGSARVVAGPGPFRVFADLTLGGGGHAEALLQGDPTARLIGVDRDDAAIAAASVRLAPFAQRVRFVRSAFSSAESVLEGALSELCAPFPAPPALDGVVADLGVSSPQLDDASRGMSLRREASDAPLDMRMDQRCETTARSLIEDLSEQDLANVIFELGEERRSRRIAKSIKAALDEGVLETTGDLRHAVYRAVGGKRPGDLDPATRTFQALRIAVNDELGELDRLLEMLHTLVAPGGVAAVISFHSLEDRRVKQAFLARERWTRLTKKPVIAGDAELSRNPRARSAKLRAARREELS